MTNTTNHVVETAALELPPRAQAALLLLAAEEMSFDTAIDSSIFRLAWEALNGDDEARRVVRAIDYSGEMSGSARQVLDLMSSRINLQRALGDVFNSGLDLNWLLTAVEELRATADSNEQLDPELLRHNMKVRLRL